MTDIRALQGLCAAPQYDYKMGTELYQTQWKRMEQTKQKKVVQMVMSLFLKFMLAEMHFVMKHEDKLSFVRAMHSCVQHTEGCLEKKRVKLLYKYNDREPVLMQKYHNFLKLHCSHCLICIVMITILPPW